MNITITINITPEEAESVVRLFKREHIPLPAILAPVPAPQQEPTVLPTTADDEPKHKRAMGKPPAVEEVVVPTEKILAPGNIAWQVEVDGFPTRWSLDYSKGQLPAVRGEDIIYQGKHYRVTKIYGNLLKVTSMDAELQSHNRA